jgi:amidohydrolase
MLERAEQLAERIVAWRQHLHQYPEVGFDEHETARFIVETLRPLGLSIREGVGKTGVVADLGAPDGDGPIVGIRADMDALPIEEQSGVSFCSLRPGVMHACGHDAHVAMALGAAHLLHQHAQEHGLAGRIRFLFQPCEETEDDEQKSGARRLVEDGAMEGVVAVVGQHVEPMTPVGRILLSPGPVAAAPDDFHITIKGHGTHAASPQRGVDPIWLSAQVLNAIYALRGRLVSPTTNAIITVGQIHGGTTENVIPSEVTLSGTIRTFDEESRQRLHDGLEQACSIARTFGGDYSLSISGGCPVLVNDERVTTVIREVAEGLIGSERIGRDEPQCGSEDFAVLAQAAPGGFWQLGVRGEGECFDCHDPRFVIDERALPLGSALLAATALRLIEQHTSGMAR